MHITTEPVLKQDWLDRPLWDRLYREAGVRQPPHRFQCTPRLMRRYLKRIGVSVEQYREMTGFSTLKAFQEANPSVPLWAFVGMVLEEKTPREYSL